MSKVVSLKEAIGEIKDGDVILTGGIVEDRRRWRGYEVVRQGKRIWY